MDAERDHRQLQQRSRPLRRAESLGQIGAELAHQMIDRATHRAAGADDGVPLLVGRHQILRHRPLRAGRRQRVSDSAKRVGPRVARLPRPRLVLQDRIGPIEASRPLQCAEVAGPQPTIAATARCAHAFLHLLEGLHVFAARRVDADLGRGVVSGDRLQQRLGRHLASHHALVRIVFRDAVEDRRASGFARHAAFPERGAHLRRDRAGAARAFPGARLARMAGAGDGPPCLRPPAPAA